MWMESKLSPPNQQLATIERTQLLPLLAQAEQVDLVLFFSPAGYGKTTAAAQWLKEKDFAWINLDEMDNDLKYFGHFLIQALHQLGHESCPQTLALAQTGQFNSLIPLLTQAFHELSFTSSHKYLVLDDYHWIKNEDIHQGIRFLLKHLPPQLTLVLTSRTLPCLNIASLRIRRQMIEITHQELAFDLNETEQFLTSQKRHDLSPQAIENIHQSTEGWPCVLQLIALDQKQSAKHLFVQDDISEQMNLDALDASFNRSYLWDYLAEEVFDALDSSTQDFLLQCSVLDMFNAQLVSHVTAHNDALAKLEKLNKVGLFLSPLGVDNWFRFHNLFAQFLRHQALTLYPHKIKEWHQSAAQAWIAQNDHPQALRHAIKSVQTPDSAAEEVAQIQIENIDYLVEFLNQHAWELFHQGQLNLLEMAFKLIPSQVRFAHPKICLVKAWLAQSQYEYRKVESMISEAEQAFAMQNIKLTDNQQGSFHALRAQASINLGKPHQAYKLAQQALSLLSESQYRSKIVVTSIIGEVHHCLGDLNRALSMMQQTEKMAHQYGVYHQALWAIIQQAEILLAQGHTQSSYDIVQHGFELVQTQHLQQLPLHEFLLRLHAQILYLWGRFDEAEQAVERGCQVLKAYDQNKQLHAYALMARIALTQNNQEKAQRYLSLCQKLMHHTQYHPDWLAHADSVQILYWKATGQKELLAAWLEQTQANQANNDNGLSNHFLQLQARNQVCALVGLNRSIEAMQILIKMQQAAQRHELVSDKAKNHCCEALIYEQESNYPAMLNSLVQALDFSAQSGVISPFLLLPTSLSKLLQDMAQTDVIEIHGKSYPVQLNELTRLRAKQISERLRKAPVQANFDDSFIEDLLKSNDLPEVLKLSPLTQREWQVLGLIYTGYTNEQIANQLNVAPTTIKTHIRNLYQKFNITNRIQAIEVAGQLVSQVKAPSVN